MSFFILSVYSLVQDLGGSLQNFRRTLVALSCLVVGAASFALSFVALRDVSIALGAVDPSLAFLVPIVIDGGIIGGSAVIWSYSQEQAKRPVFPFLFVASLVVISVIVNASHAGPTLLAKLIASLPPLVLLGVLELVAAQHRRTHTEVTSDIPPTSYTPSIKASKDPLLATEYNVTEGIVYNKDLHTTTQKADLPSVPLDNVDLSINHDSSIFEDLDSELETLTSANFASRKTSKKSLRVKAEEPD